MSAADDPSPDRPYVSALPLELPALPEGIFCPICGYDLRGSTSPCCAECGENLAPLRSSGSQIPWVYRRQIGRIRAYVRTTWRAVRHPRRLCAETARPISFVDARRFRRTTVLLTYLGLFGLKLAYFLGIPEGRKAMEGLEWLGAPVELGTILTLVAWTGLPSYFFHPRRLPLALQNRCVALSYYPVGALLFMLPLYVLGIVLLIVPLVFRWESFPVNWGIPLVVLGSVGFGAGLLLWWGALVTFARWSLRSTSRALLVAVVVPLLWGVVGLLIQVGIPLLVFYVAVVVRSLS